MNVSRGVISIIAWILISAVFCHAEESPIGFREYRLGQALSATHVGPEVRNFATPSLPCRQAKEGGYVFDPEYLMQTGRFYDETFRVFREPSSTDLSIGAVTYRNMFLKFWNNVLYEIVLVTEMSDEDALQTDYLIPSLTILKSVYGAPKKSPKAQPTLYTWKTPSGVIRLGYWFHNPISGQQPKCWLSFILSDVEFSAKANAFLAKAEQAEIQKKAELSKAEEEEKNRNMKAARDALLGTPK